MSLLLVLSLCFSFYFQLDACCGGNVELDAQFTPDINPQHVGMTPVSLAAALNKPELGRVSVIDLSISEPDTP